MMELEINDLLKDKIEALKISQERKKTILAFLENENDYGDSKEDMKNKISNGKHLVEKGVRNENSSD